MNDLDTIECADTELVGDYIAARVVEDGDCLRWTAGCCNGHPAMRHVDKKTALVRRILWEEKHGPIPPGKIIRQTCETPKCVNVEHSELTTYNREFFHQGLKHAVGWMWHHRDRLSFCAVPDNEKWGETMLVREEFVGLFTGEPNFYQLPDPWEKKVAAAESVVEAAQPPGPMLSVNFEGSGL